MFYVIIVALTVTVAIMILDNHPETKEKIVSWLKDTIKWIAICAVVVAAFFAMVYFSMPAKAEELPEDLYYKVVFVDEVEELEEELLLHGNDADRLWDWYEDYPEEDEEFFYYEFNKELSNLALCWAQENGFFVQLDKEDRIIKDRIVVLTMRYSDDPLGDEAIDSYFTEFITR